MYSDTTIVLGVRGKGKSLWSRIKTLSAPRLFVFDPKAEYENVQWIPDDYQLVQMFDAGAFAPDKSFRVGVSHPDFVQTLGSIAYEAGVCTLVLEEFFMLYGRGENLPDWLSEYLFLGRPRRLDAIAVSQRAANIPIALRSQATRLVSFQQTEPEDLDVLRKWIGRENAEQISTLSVGMCVDVSDGQCVCYSIKALAAERLRIHIVDRQKSLLL